LQSQKMDSIGRLAGGLAHDFNNMLGVILGSADLALEEIDTDDPIHAELVEIQKAAERSADLTRQLLAFARQQSFAPGVLNLNDAVGGMMEMLRRLIGENIQLSWEPVPKIWRVKMDPSQIDQVLANLCINAQDAIENTGHIAIKLRNKRFDEAYCEDHPRFEVGEFVQLTVSDDGHGMDQSTLEKIYEPFFTTKELGRGTGLGLATVYGIVQQNAGLINVRSVLGKGTTFEVYLPRYAATGPNSSDEDSALPAAGGNETILLVEDEPAILKLAGSMLERLGYTVLSAATPGEALRQAKARVGEIDLLLVDIIMPDMNGWDLATKLSSLDTKPRQIFMSGYTADVIVDTGVRIEDLHFLQKPFTQRELAAKIKEAFASE